MVKIDLVTGFLGAGKTTFISNYVDYLLAQKEKVAIIENDYGAINVDMMLLSNLQKKNVKVEMVAGGCDYDCHKRRFKTKLITLALLGYDRVIVEPSGIFDIDEFYDLLNEDELYERYEIANVIGIVNAGLETDLSLQSRYMLASQLITAGILVFSHTHNCPIDTINQTLTLINSSICTINGKRHFNLENDCIIKDWNTFSNTDFKRITSAGYNPYSFTKLFTIDDNYFQSLFFMNLSCDEKTLIANINNIWDNPQLGNIMRIKGFIPKGDKWLQLNATKENVSTKEVDNGQNIIIVIGENLQIEQISNYFPAANSTYQVARDAKEIAKIKQS